MSTRQASFIGFLLAWTVVPVSLLRSQEQREPDIWQWTERAPHHDPVVRLRVGEAQGTGIVFHVDKTRPSADGYLGHCLTAYHVVQADGNQGKIRVEYRNGRRGHNGRVIAHDQENDVAIVWVWVPAQVVPALLADEPVRPRDPLEFAGLGGGVDLQCCLRHFSALAAVSTDPNRIYADVALLPGDSGGPVFNRRREVVGVISGGWFWFQRDASGNTQTTRIQTTWPARACNVTPIRNLLDKPAGCVGDGCGVRLADLRRKPQDNPER